MRINLQYKYSTFFLICTVYFEFFEEFVETYQILVFKKLENQTESLQFFDFYCIIKSADLYG